jgi:hypothetical protein
MREKGNARVLIHLVASISVRTSPSRMVNLELRSCERRESQSRSEGKKGESQRTMMLISSCLSS